MTDSHNACSAGSMDETFVEWLGKTRKKLEGMMSSTYDFPSDNEGIGHTGDDAQPAPKRRKLAEKYERILDRAKTMRRTSMEMRVFEDDMETIIAALRASQPSPAATVDLTNHHNALKCPYCNPKGLQFAEPHEGCSAGNVDEPRDWFGDLNNRLAKGLLAPLEPPAGNEPVAWLVTWTTKNNGPTASAYIRERDARDAARNVEKYADASNVVVAPAYTATEPQTFPMWQPIETAPRDGTCVLITDFDGVEVVAFWQNGQWLVRWDHEPYESPTHWHALPSPLSRPKLGGGDK